MLKQPWHFTSFTKSKRTKLTSTHLYAKLRYRSKDENIWKKEKVLIKYHEERIGRLNETLEFVLLLLKLCWRIQQIDIVLENLTSFKYPQIRFNYEKQHKGNNKNTKSGLNRPFLVGWWMFQKQPKNPCSLVGGRAEKR